ncbi:subtilisin-like protease SBT1.7 [Bidens hawaiensis]|uniref:subtilisin-like protease SBT1.7 n=1 Tax=Bidens hawaiensis TaxID=980011 RepID=UPI00404B873D
MNLRNAVLIAVLLAVFCYRYVASDWKHLDQKTYIVHMDKSVMPSPFSNHLQWYETTMRSVSKSSNMLYTYNKVMHGFSARLTVDEANLLKQQHGILSVHEEPIYQLHTTRSPEFLGLERSDVMLPEFNSGSNVIVGVVDTGVWPGKSLDDTGFGPIPIKWKGKCKAGKGFKKSFCNRKLIGARYFLKSYEVWNNGTIDESVESRSPLDDEGHGTHTATTAAGSAVAGASLFGYAKGTARGMAPHARLAVYKACWLGGCFGGDVLAALEKAIIDGVDILSLSIGKPVMDYFEDTYAYGAFKAVSHGIFVSFSAGNDGPGALTVENVAPWVVTVGAASLDRDFPAYITLGNGKKLSGVSFYTSEEPLSRSMVPLVFAGSVSNKTNSSVCYPGSFAPGSVTGKIVMCEMGLFSDVQKGMVVKAAGGAGMILANTAYLLKELELDLQVLPTVVVNNIAHDAIKKYIASNHNSKAKFTFQGTKLGVHPSPIVAKFSSRGPNPLTPHLLKPDVIAPGVSILAGWTGKVSPTGLTIDSRRTEFNIISGTSMACPHVSGLAVLLKIAHPDWSPAAMQSALMTTAYNTYKNGKELLDVATGKPATPFDLGAGHVDPVSALDPGLVYNASSDDYLSFLCALNYSSNSIKVFDGSFKCVKGKKYREEDLNYPSFAVPLPAVSGQTVVKYTRTLTNVGTPMTYKVSSSLKTDSVKIKVEPEELTFIKKNEKKMYSVTFIAGSMPLGTTSFGHLTWSGGKYVVTSPIAFSWD